MKIVITLDEVRGIVEKELLKRGLSIRKSSGSITSHIEGQYEDSQQVVDGMSFDMVEKDDRRCAKCGYIGPCNTCPNCIRPTEEVE